MTSAADREAYEQWLTHHPHGSLWQSLKWEAYQRALGRDTRIYVAEESGEIVASALIIIDRTTGGFSTWECPRGPVVSDERFAASGKLIETIIQDAKAEQCITLFMSPPISLTANRLQLTASNRHIHPQATLILDLTLSDDQLLAQMHPKGRYNIKVAKKEGVTVEKSTDIDIFYSLLQATGSRDGFRIHSKAHYARFVDALPSSFLLIAKYAEKPIAGLLGVTWNGTGVYYYGASSSEHRNLMAPYLLQWEALHLCKASGCTTYDLLGIDSPSQPPTAWKGVTEFKYKFGGSVVEYPAEQQLVLRPWAMRALAVKRKFLG